MNQTNIGTGPENKLLYNGKELQDDVIAGTKLDWYDYGARMYDAAIGRFHTQDRFAEKYFAFSPYQYAGNSPFVNLEINGDSIWHVNAKGKVTHSEGPRDFAGNHTLYSVNEKDERGKSVVVKDGNILDQLEKGTNSVSRRYDGSIITGHIANTNNRKDGYSLFKFVAENTNVEWSYQEYTDKTASIGTYFENAIALAGTRHETNKDKIISFDIHNHPNGDTRPSGNDMERMRYFYNKNPKVKVWLYIPQAENKSTRMLDLINWKWITKF